MLRLPPRSLPPPGSFLADLAEGWHELAIRPWYWINLIAHACWNFAMPAMLVLGPVIAARSLGGATAWGLISASFGVGAVAAGLFVLRVKPRRPLVVGNLLLTLGALPLLALAFSRSVPLICAANVLDGFGLVALERPVDADHPGADPGERAVPGQFLRLAGLAGHHAGRLRGGGAAWRLHRLHLDPGRAPRSCSRSRARWWCWCPASAACTGPRRARSSGPRPRRTSRPRPNRAALNGIG